MKEIKFKSLDESIFKSELINGVPVYLYSTDKTKNFFVTVSFKYGAKVLSYKVNNQKSYNDIIPGSAHFLEHLLMNFDSKDYKVLNKLGSRANAWTGYRGTNYNIYGSCDILKNLEILLNFVFNPKFNASTVNAEKSTIGEEIDQYEDDIIALLYDKIYKNIFVNSYVKNKILGTRKDLQSITVNSLNKIYEDFYTLDNMFISVVGNFNKKEVTEFLNNYMNKIPFQKSKKIKIKNINEPDEVNVSYEEIKKEAEIPKIFYGIKLPLKTFKNINYLYLSLYLAILFDYKFSSTSESYEKYKKEGTAIYLNTEIIRVDKHILILIKAITKVPDKFISSLKKDLSEFNINEATFLRKKKILLSNLILSFENIEDIELEKITNPLLIYEKIINNEYEIIKKLNYKEIKRIEKLLDFKNHSILKVIK